MLFIFKYRFSKTYSYSDPNDMRVAKLFIKLYSAGSIGIIGEKATTHTIAGFWKRFTAAWWWKTSSSISSEVRRTVANVFFKVTSMPSFICWTNIF